MSNGTIHEALVRAETCPRCGSADVWTSVPLLGDVGYRWLHFCRGCRAWWETFEVFRWLRG